MSNVMTPAFRISYPNLFKAKKNDLNGKDEFSVVALFPKGANLDALKKAAQAAVVKKFGSDQSKWPKNMRSPFRDQSEREKDGVMPAGHEKGAFFMTLKSSDKPLIVDENAQPILDTSTVYAGCWMQAQVNAYAYLQKGNAGVSFGLAGIQKVKDDQPLGGGRASLQDFKPVEGAAEATAADATGLFS